MPIKSPCGKRGGGAAWNVAAFRRAGDARSIPRIRIPGEHTRDRNVLVGRLSEIPNDKRPGRKVAAMFIDMAISSPISGGGAAWNVAAFRRGGDARSIPRIRIPGEHTRDRNVLVGRLAEILKDKRPGRVVAAMFLDMAFGSPIYERLRALGFNNVFEVNFGLTHTPDRAKANMRAYMWGEMKDWLLTGAIETDEKMAMDLAGPGAITSTAATCWCWKARRTCRSAARRRPTMATPSR
jgi:hypothetical protein